MLNYLQQERVAGGELSPIRKDNLCLDTDLFEMIVTFSDPDLKVKLQI